MQTPFLLTHVRTERISTLSIGDSSIAFALASVISSPDLTISSPVVGWITRYFLLNDIYEKFGKNKAERDAELYKHHFEFAANLENYLSEKQVEQVKDGMTFGVVPKTYQAHLEMIPSLKENEKLQILNWLKEAREFAIDAENSKAKHGWFGKYKGRINNWLTKRGYDLKAEREGWYKRIEAAKKK